MSFILSLMPVHSSWASDEMQFLMKVGVSFAIALPTNSVVWDKFSHPGQTILVAMGVLNMMGFQHSRNSRMSNLGERLIKDAEVNGN